MGEEVVEIIDSDGNVAHKGAAWFPEDAELGAEVVTLVAVLGAQASGKSTLLNATLGTEFAVGSRGSVGSATTKGISVAKAAASKYLYAMDIEGSDSRDRGKAGKFFHRKCATFAAAVADVLLVNLWYHDVGRLDTTAYTLLDAVFAESKADDAKTALVVVVRDVEDDVDLAALEELLARDVEEVWARSRDDSAPLDDAFDLSVFTLPHMRHRPEGFKESCGVLAQRLLDPDVEDCITNLDYSKGMPFDGVGSFCSSIWESWDGRDNGSESVMSAYECNEAFSAALGDAHQKLESLSATLANGETIDDFGTRAEEIITAAVAKYDKETEKYRDEAIQSRKRHELESIIDTSQHAIFMKQMQLLRENALLHFKSATSSDDMPSDFAFFSAVSQFIRDTEKSTRPGSSWSSAQEREDLQSMMQEISTQRKKLLTSQVSAAQQQANAMQYLQMQHTQMNAIQAQAYGGSGPGQWNVGAAYRPPDTNINASLSYQQGRTNIQISMVPDESAALLGPNGFSGGVGPGNLGLSFNIGYVSDWRACAGDDALLTCCSYFVVAQPVTGSNWRHFICRIIIDDDSYKQTFVVIACPCVLFLALS